MGNSLTAIREKVEAIERDASDHIFWTNHMLFQPRQGGLSLTIPQTDMIDLSLTDTAANQLAAMTNIPNAYCRRLATEDPELLAHNVMQRLRRLPHERKMIRCMEQRQSVRAILSPAYARIPASVFLELAAPMLEELSAEGGVTWQRSDVTPDNLHLRITLNRPTKVREDDIVKPGFDLRTSETGLSAAELCMIVHRVVCSNGLMVPKTISGVRRIHRGAHAGGSDYHGRNNELSPPDPGETRHRLGEFFTQAHRSILNIDGDMKRWMDRIHRLNKIPAHGWPDSIFGHRLLGLNKREIGDACTAFNRVRHLRTAWDVLNCVTALAHTAAESRKPELEATGGKFLSFTEARIRDIVQAN